MTFQMKQEYKSLSKKRDIELVAEKEYKIQRKQTRRIKVQTKKGWKSTHRKEINSRSIERRIVNFKKRKKDPNKKVKWLGLLWNHNKKLSFSPQ